MGKQQRKRKRDADPDAAVETTPENSEDEETILPRVHATRARVAKVPEIPLPRTDRQSRSRSDSAQPPAAKPPRPQVPGKRLRPGGSRNNPAINPAIVEGSSTDPHPTVPSHRVPRGVGPAGRVKKVLARGSKTADRGDSALDSISSAADLRTAEVLSTEAAPPSKRLVPDVR